MSKEFHYQAGSSCQVIVEKNKVKRNLRNDHE